MTRVHEFRRRRLAARRKHVSVGKPLLFLTVPLIAVSLILCMAVFTSAAEFYAGVTDSVKPPDQAIAERGGGAQIYARNGQLLYEFLDQNYGYQTRVKLDQIAPALQDATISAEDASFCDNPGLNVRGLVRAAVENLKPGGTFLQGSGDSSITQQLVKQIYFTPQEREERSFARKFREAALAVRLTQKYDKDQILEWYLNEIPYGGIFTGIEAASEGYFGVPASDVTLGQAAFLAGLPQSPSRFDPFMHFDAAKARQFDVLNLMATHGFITQQMVDWAKLEVIELHPRPQAFLAPHLPLEIQKRGFDGTEIARVVLSSHDAAARGRTGLSDWLRQAEAEWRKHKKGTERIATLGDRLDYDSNLTRQRPSQGWKVLYNAAGTFLAACALDTSRT